MVGLLTTGGYHRRLPCDDVAISLFLAFLLANNMSLGGRINWLITIPRLLFVVVIKLHVFG